MRLFSRTVSFYVSAVMVMVFVGLAAAFTGPMGRLFDRLQETIVLRFGWFYVLAVGFFLLFVLWLLISPYGHIRLGKDDDEPEYSYLTWFAMLFSAGMGIGLLFYSVAEPVLHFDNPHLGELPGSLEAAREAMNTTFLHWGLHAWSIYIIVGISLAYFAYRHDLPLTIRSTFYPLIGERIYGPIGHAVEILAVFGTLFGVATSLGLGVMQINTGMDFLGLLQVSVSNQLWLIAGITLAATLSVVSGLDRGIRRLSELNLLLGLGLLLFVFFAGPTTFLLRNFVQSIGHYLQSLPAMTFRTDAYLGPDWQKSWTMFYWGWWISWSPFVGMFIARISRGRTIREFIAGVLLVPTLLTFFWMVTFGGSALHRELFGPGGVVEATSESIPTALFVLLQGFPFQGISTILATVVIATYFITSSDSGSLVIDILTSEGDPDPPVAQRIFWALTEGAVAAVLLLVGGLQALQTAAITTAAPFCLIMVIMCYSLIKGLQAERRRQVARQPGEPLLAELGGEGLPSEGADWRVRLAEVVDRRRLTEEKQRRAKEETACGIPEFIEQTVLPAFRELRKELESHGREAVIERKRNQASLTVLYQGDEEFNYRIRGHIHRRLAFAFPEMGRERRPPTCWAEVLLRDSVQKEDELEKFTREKIVADFLYEYAKWIGW